MSLLVTEAFVLSTLRLGEADKLVNFYTAARGRMTGVASGARRFKNRFGAALEPLTQGRLIAFEKGQNKLARVRQVDIVHSFQKLRDHWETIVLGTRIVRVILRMTPEEEPHPELYQLLQKTLLFLETGVDRSLSFILFMLHLIATCGYQLQWNRCVRCGESAVNSSMDFPMNRLNRGKGESRRQILLASYQEGGRVCPRCGDAATRSLSEEARIFLQSAAETDFAAAHHLALSPRARREVETILNDYIAYILGKPPSVLFPVEAGQGQGLL